MYIFDLPFSAFVLCYGPLALTIIGFIAAAVLTDREAGRSYLRNIDTRQDPQIDMDPPRNVTTTLNAITPSGGKVTIRPNDNADASGASDTEAQAAVSERVADTPATTAPDVPAEPAAPSQPQASDSAPSEPAEPAEPTTPATGTTSAPNGDVTPFDDVDNTDNADNTSNA